MILKCIKCGQAFEGKFGTTLCPACAAASKASVHMRPRVCRQCGVTFMGGPRAWYCPSCRIERRREADARHKRNGTARPIGSIDTCAICGKEYIVTGGKQKYCPDCAPEAVAQIKRASSIEWNRLHVDQEQRKADRHAAVAEITCAVCGKKFTPGVGSPQTCSPECAKEFAKRECARWEKEHRSERNAYRREKYNAARPLGSIDRCQICGKEYVVTNPRQKYCPECGDKVRSHKIVLS